MTFSLDGVSYEIDLSTSNAAALRDAFRKYVAAASTASHGRRNTASVSAGKIRTWAKAHGVTIADHGTIPEQIRRNTNRSTNRGTALTSASSRVIHPLHGFWSSQASPDELPPLPGRSRSILSNRRLDRMNEAVVRRHGRCRFSPAGAQAFDA